MDGCQNVGIAQVVSSSEGLTTIFAMSKCDCNLRLQSYRGRFEITGWTSRVAFYRVVSFFDVHMEGSLSRKFRIMSICIQSISGGRRGQPANVRCCGTQKRGSRLLT